METETDAGLVIGHAYGLTAAKTVHIKGTGVFHVFGREKLRMVRLQNPWGGSDWKGAFSDGCVMSACQIRGTRYMTFYVFL